MKALTTVAEFEALTKGQKIQVSDGTQEPPKHHKKKHRNWSARNYIGYFFEFEFSCGRHEVRVDGTGSGILINCYDMRSRAFSLVE